MESITVEFAVAQSSDLSAKNFTLVGQRLPEADTMAVIQLFDSKNYTMTLPKHPKRHNFFGEFIENIEYNDLEINPILYPEIQNFNEIQNLDALITTHQPTTKSLSLSSQTASPKNELSSLMPEDSQQIERGSNDSTIVILQPEMDQSKQDTAAYVVFGITMGCLVILAILLIFKRFRIFWRQPKRHEREPVSY